MVKICNYHSECNREASETVSLVVNGEPFDNVRVCEKHAKEAQEEFTA